MKVSILLLVRLPETLKADINYRLHNVPFYT